MTRIEENREGKGLVEDYMGNENRKKKKKKEEKCLMQYIGVFLSK